MACTQTASRDRRLRAGGPARAQRRVSRTALTYTMTKGMKPSSPIIANTCRNSLCGTPGLSAYLPSALGPNETRYSRFWSLKVR